ncbi:hypothetical protein OSB04_005556 [Centaurea solstitialis]|uniref:Reverse transcriptase Ty1/copia-type domain-containing protein n=1 Tax=Centaurea solstitialis TaxID=347529 RepID=A0AA38TRU0_9ASTR|nr:hypothetical protein OSB04_005556 [Centaurea solstitialis]
MDTGASGHMEQPGMTSPFIFNTCTNKQIIVGNDTTIPVIGQGNKTLPPPFPPLKLNNILYAPNLIKNLISVRRLTTDNLLSIEFDPFGFLVKDLKTKEPILRCNSSGDLYPLTTNFIKPPSKPIALAAVTQDRWHQRLGHPGKSLLHSLKSSSFIDLFEESIFPFSIQHSNTTLDYNFLSPPFNPLLWDNVRSSQPISPPNAPHPASLGPTPAPLAQTLSPPSAHPSDLAPNTQTLPQLSPQPTPPHSVPQQRPVPCALEQWTETVYMHQPMGFRHRDYPDHVCRLKKSLYGLKQAPRAWYQRFTDFVLQHGFTQCKTDNSLFIYHHGHDVAYLIIYVDDIILTTSSDQLRQQLMTILAGEFAMKDLGPLSYFLGISVTRTGDTLFLSQHAYAKDIIHRAGMDSCKPAATPVDTQSKLASEPDSLFDDPTTYRSLAGALQYLTFTRPDIAYAVQQICMHMHSPCMAHWNALKRIIRYLQGTTDYGLHLRYSSALSIRAYTDADWAGCPDTRRSTSGYCVYLGDNLISWSSKRQSTISHSSAEAEYRGVANVVAEICWLRNLLLELHRPLTKASLVYCDNVSAIYLSGTPVQHQRTKHIELDIHFVREHVQKGLVRILHMSSRFQIADIFTKGLPRVLFDDFRSSLSIRSPPTSTAGV